MHTTMFQHYGGFAVLRKIVSAFYDRVLDSPVISHHFANVDMRRLIEHQTQFMTFLMDGPSVGYSDDTLRRVHAPLGITSAEFDEMVGLLLETLEDFEFDQADVAVVGERLRQRESVIVGALSPR